MYASKRKSSRSKIRLLNNDQSTFSMTDGDWPRVMRVNPIFGWGYGHVWRFVRGLSLEYPSLYDQGYTSLGNKAWLPHSNSRIFRLYVFGPSGF